VPEERPSIVLFMVDQLSAKWLEGESRPCCPTPHIDGLRARGVSFSQCIVSNPVCMAARATLATGLTTRGHGVLQNGYELDPALPTFMQLLRQRRWRTGAFGKLHFIPHFRTVYPDYKPYGFDFVSCTEDPRAGEWLDWVEAQYPSLYDSALATVWATELPDLKSYGRTRADLAARIRDLRARFPWATPGCPNATPGYYPLPLPEEASQTAWITRRAIEFLDKFAPHMPVFAQVSYVQPHSPSCPPEDHMERVDRRYIPPPVPPEWAAEGKAPECFARSEGAHRQTPDHWHALRHYYFADLTHLDDQLGKVLAALDQLGRRANTYVVFTSDHGELLLDHGFTGKGERHYDACVRVPLIIAGPGLKAGSTVDALVQLEDLCPTILDMAGVAYPEPPVTGPYHQGPKPRALPGRSLLPLCRGQAVPRDWRDAAYVESFNNITGSDTACWARTIRTSEWRYTMYPGGTGEQLFRIREDPNELRNLAFDPRFANARSRLRDRLMELLVLQDYPHPPRSRFALGVH
jgi:arylsulfatase A-like enzyme